VRLGPRRSAAWIAVAVASIYGVSDEFHQSFTPGRSVEIADWLADTCGAALAVGLYVLWPRYRKFLEAPVVRQRRIENPAEAATVSR
jgi:VanZ family protein